MQWRFARPALGSPEELSLYELHVRDFSISDQTVPAERRGTYAAFTVPGAEEADRVAAVLDVNRASAP